MKNPNITSETFSGYRHENFAVLQLKRHFLLRTTNLQLRDMALDFLDRISEDRSAKLLVLIGASDAKGREEFNEFFRNFYAKGMDLTLIHRMYNVISQLVLKLASLDKFVIYVNSGNVLASFLNIGLACDYRMLADNALVQNPCIEMGLVAKGGGAYFLPKILGTTRTYEILLSEADLDAFKAKELGLVHELLPAAATNEQAFARAAEFAAKPASSLSAIKKLINYSYKDLREYLDYENDILINIIRLNELTGHWG